MLSHPHRRQVEHLPPLHPNLRTVGQVRTTANTRARLIPQPLVRVANLRQRRPRMPLLPTRLPPAPAAQPLQLGHDERRVRRWRPRRVLAVLLQRPRQLRDLSLQRLDHRPMLRVLSGKLLIRRTRIDRHHTIINNLLPNSTNHAEDLTSYRSIITAANDHDPRSYTSIATRSVPNQTHG
jgi:hypothetical protein